MVVVVVVAVKVVVVIVELAGIRPSVFGYAIEVVLRQVHSPYALEQRYALLELLRSSSISSSSSFSCTIK